MPADDSAADAPRPFPPTSWSVIRDAADTASPTYRASMERLATVYWKPVYGHLRRKWNLPHDRAKDLTQDFFAALCEKNFLPRLDPEAGLFRSYVQRTLDNYVRADHRQQGAQKRGGGVRHVPLDVGETFEPSSADTPEAAYLKDWARATLDDALRQMHSEYAPQPAVFELFVLHDVQRPPGADVSYQALADRFSVSVTDVTNHLYRARKRLRELVLMRVRETTSNDREAEQEMRALFGADA